MGTYPADPEARLFLDKKAADAAEVRKAIKRTFRAIGEKIAELDEELASGHVSLRVH